MWCKQAMFNEIHNIIVNQTNIFDYTKNHKQNWQYAAIFGTLFYWNSTIIE